MEAQALTALISAGAGLLGALIGFLGTQRANKRIVDLAREQRRFERAQEMRAEVIPRYLTLLGDMEGGFSSILELPHR